MRRLIGALLLAGCASVSAGAQPVLTFHNDAARTGWDQTETQLTTATVGAGAFALQQSVTLDEQVDTQPLVVDRQVVAGHRAKSVVYVATANDTVYAIDGSTGAILLSRTLGAPVPQWALPGQCWNNAPNIGVDSTPVISRAAGALYLIADTFENGAPVLRLHALGLGDLQDLVPPVVVSATRTLADGTPFTLDPSAARQRSALLLAGGKVYAGFASYCDINADRSRGWLLGWDAQSLQPLPGSELTNRDPAAPDNFYLSSIWMSGSGPANSPPDRSIYFVTGNSDYSGTTFNAVTNLSESLVRVSSDLTRVLGHFTPDNEVSLEQDDTDFGSGGVMLPPLQPGANPSLAVAAGKDGQLYLLDRAAIGGPPLGAYPIGPCWCAPSYFQGADGTGRIVTSGGSAVDIWRLQTASDAPASLTQEQSVPIVTGQDGGFLTSVSSNHLQPGSAVIWAVGRPTDSDPANVRLDAIDPITGLVIFSGVAGTWPNTGGNANIVPTVANGHVYVASDRELAIFGLGAPATPAAQAAILAARSAARAASAAILRLAPGEHAISGRVLRVDPSALTLRQRSGALLRVDIAAARRRSEMAVPVVGRAMLVVGAYAPGGGFAAHYLQRVKSAPALWPADR